MQTSDFTGDMPGEFVRTLDGHQAFLPNPLPPSVIWNNDLVNLLSEADRAMGRLAGVGTADIGGINPNLLIRPFMRREAVLSSQIEGTQASLSDLLLFEELPNIEDRVPDVREVANYVRALEFGLESLRHRPLKLGMIRELHHVLMTGVRGGDKTPGALRNIQVFIGPTINMADARFVPPPPLHVPTALEALEKFIETPSTLPPLIRIALVHYQFEAIHPFQDGNGRIGRLLITLMLAADQLLPQPMFYLSAYFERRRADYYRHLLEVSLKGAWTEWLSFFLKGVSDQANDSLQRVTRLLQLRHKYRAKLLHARSSSLTLKLIDELFSNPVITPARAAAALDVSPTTAKSHIDRLVDAKILKETTGQKRGRVYIAVGVVRSLDMPGEK